MASQQTYSPGALSKIQIQNLTTAQIQSFTQENLDFFDAEDFSQFSSAQLNSFKTDVVSQFQSNQIAALSAKQINGLTENVFSSLTPEQISSIDATQVAKLSLAKINLLSADAIGDLTVPQVSALNAKQLFTLSANKLNHFKEDQLNSLSAKQFAGLSLTALNGLDSDHLGYFGASGIAKLSSKQLASLSVDAMAGLTEAQIKQLSLKQMLALKPEQIGAFGIDQLPQLSTDQLRVLSAKQLNQLSPDQVQSLTSKQIGKLTATQIKSLGDTFIRALGVDQIAALTNSQTAALTTHQINLMSDEQIQAISFAEPPGNHAPVAKDNNYSVKANNALTGKNIITDVDQAKGKDSDADTGDALTLSHIEGKPWSAIADSEDTDHLAAEGWKQQVLQHGTIYLKQDGTMHYSPDDTSGDTFTYKISDGTDYSGAATVTLVTEASLLDDSQTINEDAVASGNLLTNDNGYENNLSVSSFSFSSNGSTVTYAASATARDIKSASNVQICTIAIQSSGAYTFTPASNWNGEVPEVTYTTNAGSTAKLALTVTAVDDPSVMVNDSQTTNEDAVASGNVLTNDSDVDNTLSVGSFSFSSNGSTVTYAASATARDIKSASNVQIGTIKILSSGDYTFTPASNWNGTVPVVTYTTNTGSTATLSITVTAVNDPPVAHDNNYSMANLNNGVLTGNIITDAQNSDQADLDPENDTLQVSEINGQSWASLTDDANDADYKTVALNNGQLRLKSDGTMEYTPNDADNPVSDSFTYKISDGTANSGVANVGFTSP